MFWMGLAQVRTWSNPGDAHLAHVALYRGSGNMRAFSPQLGGDPSRAVVGMGGVDFIDAMLDGNFSLGRTHRLVIQARATDTQQFGLDPQGDLRMPSLQPLQPFNSRSVRCQIFF